MKICDGSNHRNLHFQSLGLLEHKRSFAETAWSRKKMHVVFCTDYLWLCLMPAEPHKSLAMAREQRGRFAKDEEKFDDVN